MVMWEMTSRCTEPYKGHTPDVIAFCIANEYTEDIPEDTPVKYADWIRKCWNKNPHEQPDAVIVNNDAEILNNNRVAERDNECDEDLAEDDAESEVPARAWKAVKSGDMTAQFWLGLAYKSGEGVPQDDSKAVEWFQKAAEQEHDEAQYHLGLAYESGEGVPQDYTKAVEWYLSAAEHGVLYAQHNLGLLLLHGKGVLRDCTKVFQWFQKAAKQGILSSQYTLEKMYWTGSGVLQDPVKAMEWFRRAAIKDTWTLNSPWL